MKIFKKTILISILLFGLLCIWQWLDKKDYFQTEYNNLKKEQESIFIWKDGDSDSSIKERYRNHFTDKEYSFPRQHVAKIKLIENKLIIGLFTNRTLKKSEIDYFVNYCNDTTNFHWGETTLQTSESEYFFRLYNDKNKVIGKIYFCLDGCGMTRSIPTCPAMKFGGLSKKGQQQIEKLINDKTKWD
ncbi:hypothetical protein [Chryseobacterium sp. CFBP8996]|uniref:hypothetical protein n=1 Tax=Chryseobacterium sp. CFBP8996 TaxID=3096529 RepID=UPI002A6ABD54|nr:hypothetical protein [Chryseobacterium sp. CFBP8996]MDY0931693.1 hypothetical protein [Chryseobacterium sp. CFBP8996]